MKGGLKYKIKGNTLIIDAGLNDDSISYVRNILSKKTFINELVIGEGIEVIGNSYFRYSYNISKVTFPKSLKKIGEMAFANCNHLATISIPNKLTNTLEIGSCAFHSCISLRKIKIPEGVIKVEDKVFRHCILLEDISLPESLTYLGACAFAECKSLKSVRLPANLEIIRESTFFNCKVLKNINLPKKLSIIEESAFYGCQFITSMKFPDTLVDIGHVAFENCENLKKVQFNEGLKRIGNSSFDACKSLEEVKLPSTLNFIGYRAFAFCSNLKHADVDGNNINISEAMFFGCNSLKSVTLSGNIREIGKDAFRRCNALEEIVLPDSVSKLNTSNFINCHKLKNITLSENIKTIPGFTFDTLEELKKIIIPEGIAKIEESAFFNCQALEEVYLPTTLKNIHKCAFDVCNLKHLYLKSNDEFIHLDMDNGKRKFLENHDNILFLRNCESDTYEFYMNGEYVEFNEKDLLNNQTIAKFIDKKIYDEKMYIRLYCFSKKRFVPSDVIIENIPIRDVDNFYVNKNGKEWGRLVRESNIVKKENRVSFFKLCYVLGVFSPSTNIRDKAIQFLDENIINQVHENYIHSRFDGFDLSNGFNEEYAEFFMKYYKSKDFMYVEDEDEWGDGETIDLMAASYNDFRKVKKIYPSKTLHTNRIADLLTPIHVINAIQLVEYIDVDPENEKFALIVGRYGYTQEQFEKLQKWYNIAKSLTKLSLFVSEDSKKEGITYKLLSKDDPIIAVLGNITNCCQVVGGMAESCVEHGMTQLNSGFVTFNCNGKIIGQSWVWYDEESKTVCLDNIEVPRKYLEKINQNKNVQKEFVDCLVRISDGFKVEMKNKGYEVNHVTIGEGYNDLKVVLNNAFSLSKNSSLLKGYAGYSDAKTQYEIKTFSKNR